MHTYKKHAYEIDIVNGPIFKNVVIFSLPILFSAFLQLLYHAADVVVVGKFAGDVALASVSSTGSLSALIINFFIGMSIGTGVVVAQSIGANNRERLFKAVHTSMLLSLIVGVTALVIGFFLSPEILKLMKMPSEVLTPATNYIKVIFLGVPASMVYNFGAAILRSAGDTRRPLVILAVSGIVNVILNLVFVIIFHLDAVGVGIATIISQYLSAAAVVVILISDHADYRLNLSSLKIYKAQLLDILRLGLPAGIQSAMFATSNILIQSSINSFGTIAIAGNGAAASVDAFVYTGADVSTAAAATFVGQNFGAKKFDRIKKSLYSCMSLAIISGVITATLVLVFHTPLLSLYTDTQEAMQVAMTRLWIMAPIYFFCGLLNCVSNSTRAMGHSFVPMVLSIFFICIFRMIWLFTIFKAFPFLQTIYLSFPVSWILGTAAQSILFAIVYKKEKRLSQIQ